MRGDRVLFRSANLTMLVHNFKTGKLTLEHLPETERLVTGYKKGCGGWGRLKKQNAR